MSSATIDLWPANISSETTLRTPVTILREQASLLGSKTQNIVLADVNSSGMEHHFYLVAPALKNYKYLLFTVVHDIGLYPLRFNQSPLGQVNAKSEDEFLKKLTEIFAHPTTKQVIEALIAQSK